MHYSTMPTLPRQQLKLTNLVSEKQKAFSHFIQVS